MSSLNALVDKFGEKLNLYTAGIDSSGVIKSNGIYDKTSWIAQITQTDEIFKDLLTGWINLTPGASRTQIGTFDIRRSRLIGATEDEKCSVVTVSGEFFTTVQGAVQPWQFSVPTFYNAELEAQNFVLTSCIAVDSSANEYRALPITFPGVTDYNGFAWSNLGALDGQTITVKYTYTLSQQVPTA